MAHEVGHWVLSHNEKRNIVFNILFEPLLFGLAIWLREQKIIYEAFHFSPSDLKSLPYPLLPGLFIAQQILLKPLTDVNMSIKNKTKFIIDLSFFFIKDCCSTVESLWFSDGSGGGRVRRPNWIWTKYKTRSCPIEACCVGVPKLRSNLFILL
jgi:hypothetical protein